MTRQIIQQGIKRAIDSLASFPISLTEPFFIKIKPKFNTACWRFMPPHRIYVGDRIFTHAKKGLTLEDKLRYVEAYVKHETAHMLWTEKDLEGLNKLLQNKKIPFKLMNLFEDARIECLWRQTTSNTFQWTCFEEVLPSRLVVNGQISPLSLFFWCILHEGSVVNMERTLPLELAIMTGSTLEECEVIVKRVIRYYSRTIECQETSELIPILEEWMEEFPRTKEPLVDIPTLIDEAVPGRGDLLLPGDIPADFDFEVEDLNGQTEEDEDYTLEIKKERGTLKLAPRPIETLDRTRIAQLVQRLALLFRRKEQVSHTANPSKRISVKNYVAGRDYFKTKKETGKILKDLAILFDLSGSMRGIPLREGIHLLAVMNELAARKFVSGHVIFSMVDQQRLVYKTCALPVPEAMLVRLQAYGQAEGLELAIQENFALIRKSSTLYCYTDASITDTPINKAALHRQGIFSVGMYVGHRANKSVSLMLNYFDRALACDTLEALIEKMLLAKLIQ